jgi:ribosomal protein S18 acetylase RimI-like enzyme
MGGDKGVYRKEFYVFDGEKPVPAVIRNYGVKDFGGLIRVQRESFPPPFPPELWWNEEQLLSHVERFPEGALCIEVDGEIAGSMTGMRVRYDAAHPDLKDHTGHTDHTWEAITDGGYIRNHDPQGNTLYVVDIGVRPAFRKLGLGKWLMESMYHVVVQLKLERLLGGGRMPGYRAQSQELTAEQYLAAVVRGERKDPVISFLLRCGRTPVRTVSGYLEDEDSCDYAALMEWKNPFFSIHNLKGE